MKTYYYKAEQFLPTDIQTAWNFFSSAKNLVTITPPELDFKILTDLNDKGIYEGMIIDYTVKPLWGIPLHWKTEILKIKKPEMFVDTQLKGPYKLWEHTHIFKEKDNGVLMSDVVKYQIPFGLPGRIAHSLVIRKKLEHIFRFRKGILEKFFPVKK